MELIETAARWRSYFSELGERSLPMNILWMSRASVHSTRHSFTGDQANVTQISPGYVMTIAFGIFVPHPLGLRDLT
jgi:hypothetical protein